VLRPAIVDHFDATLAHQLPLTAKEAAWLVDQQKRSWGVRDIHPFAVCILCESCPCPADGVCYACGMTFCQMCVRRMHAKGGVQPHYPCRNSTAFSEKLVAEGKEKERENRLLKGPSNQWLMADGDFRAQRDLYKHRARVRAPEMCQYWAWGQTKYTVHLALWLPSTDTEAEIVFDVDPDSGRQRIRVKPSGCPTMIEGTLAYRADASRSGEAMTFGHMHAMTFCLPKERPGERWARFFDDDSDGAREMPLGPPRHTISTEQVDGRRTLPRGRP